MKIKKYAVGTKNVEEEVLLVNTINETEGAELYDASKGVMVHSYVHFGATKKAWKEVKSKLGLHITNTFAEFGEED